MRPDGSRRCGTARWLAVLALAVVATIAPAAPAAAGGGRPAAAADPSPTTNPFVDTKRPIEECVGSSAERPDCGRKPTQAGDRGGALQYITFLAMGSGMLFIAWRIAKGIRRRDSVMNR